MCCHVQAKAEEIGNLRAREAAADHTAQQLLAEEDQDAAKAAAQTAKKLRQKLKKQQQARNSQLSMESQDATAASLGSCSKVVRWQDASRAINNDSACLEPSVPGSDAQHCEAGSSAIQDSLSQASAAEDQGAEAVPTQDSAAQGSSFFISAAEQTEQKISLTQAPSALLLLTQRSSSQMVDHPGPARGSPGALYKLLCCPLTKVALDCSTSVYSSLLVSQGLISWLISGYDLRRVNNLKTLAVMTQF